MIIAPGLAHINTERRKLVKVAEGTALPRTRYDRYAGLVGMSKKEAEPYLRWLGISATHSTRGGPPTISSGQQVLIVTPGAPVTLYKCE